MAAGPERALHARSRDAYGRVRPPPYLWHTRTRHARAVRTMAGAHAGAPKGRCANSVTASVRKVRQTCAAAKQRLTLPWHWPRPLETPDGQMRTVCCPDLWCMLWCWTRTCRVDVIQMPDAHHAQSQGHAVQRNTCTTAEPPMQSDAAWSACQSQASRLLLQVTEPTLDLSICKALLSRAIP